jgi:hypothetical protein
MYEKVFVTAFIFALEMIKVRVSAYLFSVNPALATTTSKVFTPVLLTKSTIVDVIE